MTQLATLDQLTDVQRTGLNLLRAMDNAGLKRDTADGVWGVSFRNYFNIADRYYVYDVDTSRLPVLVNRLTDVSIVSTLQAAIGLPVRAYRDQIIDPRTGRTLPLSYMVRLVPAQPIAMPLVVPFNLADRPAGSYMFPIGLNGLSPVWESLDNPTLGHIFIAGSTGSGKSSAMRSLLSALLLTESPDDLRLMLVDPKIVEFAFWRGCPHLIGDVATDLASATQSARHIMDLVDERLEIFARHGVLDLAGYNKVAAQKLPRIVFAVDELLDLAMQGSKRSEFYTLLIRNAGKARAAGVTLVLATTDPRADTIDPALRENCKLRIAFYMADWGSSVAVIDSRAAASLPANRPGRCVARVPAQRALLTLQAYYIDEQALSHIAAQVRGSSPSPVADGSGREGVKVTDFERGMIALLTQPEDAGGLAGIFSIGRVSAALKARGLDGDRNEIARIAKEWERRTWLPLHAGGKNARRLTDQFYADTAS